jgi:hypothetical protein
LKVIDLNFDHNIGVIPTISFGLISAKAASRFRKELHLILQDLSGRAVYQTHNTKWAFLSKVVTKIENRILSSANSISCTSSKRVFHVASFTKKSNLKLIENYPIKDIPKLDLLTCRAILKLPKAKFIVLHSGNMGKQGLENLISSARILANNYEILFILAGHGN